MIATTRVLNYRLVAALAWALLATSLHARPAPLSTAFTYQGDLTQSGNPVNGTADFQFTLWDALSGPVLVAGPVAVNNVTVADGKFVASIDFGSNVFNGQARWLEIATRSPAGGGAFTTLLPRQPLTATPYALQTRGIFTDSSSNVGIGTATPDGRLQVAGGPVWTANGWTKALNIGNASAIELGNGSPTKFGIGVTTGAVTPSLFIFTTTTEGTSAPATTAMTINDAGSVGIGTSNPLFPLSITASGYGLVQTDGVREVGTYVNSSGGWFGTRTNHPLSFFTNNGFASMTVGTNGFVGIGTTAPSSPLEVLSFGSVGIRAESTPQLGTAVWDHATSSGGTNWGVQGRTSSNSGIGVLGYALAGSGTTYGVIGQTQSPSGYDFYAAGFSGGIHYGTSSSIRWKRNIERINDPLDKISQLRGVRYDWDAEHGGLHDVGMIAEEVGKVLPEIVAYEDNGVDATGMDYSKLTPLLVEALNALRAERDAQMSEQQNQIEALQSDNEDLRSRVDALEAILRRGLVRQEDPQNGNRPPH